MTASPVNECNPFQLEDREKFACIALHVPFLQAEIPWKVDTELTIFGNVGEWVRDHWREWLSPSQLESLHNSNLLIVSHAPSDKPEILDGEHNSLMSRAGTFLSSLLIVGSHIRSSPILLKGSFYESRTDIRNYSNGLGYPYLEIESPIHTVTNNNRIQESVEVFFGLIELYSRPKEFLRLKRGIRSVQEALQQKWVDQRSFYFVRSLEALHGSIRGEGRSDFVSKCIQLTGSASKYQDLFGDLYDTRNNFVHVNEFDQLLKPGEDLSTIDSRLIFQAFEAEILVLETYRRILSDASLVENFRDDQASRSHWRTAWATAVSVEDIRTRRKEELEASRF